MRRIREPGKDAGERLDIGLPIGRNQLPLAVELRRAILVQLVDADGEELHQLAREVLVRPDAVVLGNVFDPILEPAELGRERVFDKQIFKRTECVVAQTLLKFGIRVGWRASPPSTKI